MRSRLSLNAIIVALAAAAAMVLTITRPSPEGVVSLGMGDREVRAAPGAPTSSVNKHNLTALKVFNLTLVRVRDSYVDPQRIDPKEMLYAALDSVQFNIPEVLIEASPEDDQVVVSVNDKKQTFSAEDVDSPWRLSGKLKKIFRFIEANMNPGADLARVEYAAVNGMLNTLDPHSVLLDPETAREMEVSTSGKFGGLGIVIRMLEKKLTVVRPIKGTPAHRAGIKSRDHIVKIDSEVTENLTLNEAVDRMRGDPNTKVTLYIEREGESGLLRFDLTRAIIRVESVESRLLSKNVGYIRIKQFSGQTAKEVRDAMDDLAVQGARAWVVDLRANPGGLLEQAIQVSDLFLDKGTIVTTVGGRERDPRRAKRKGTDDKPVAVLVNGTSASASEIVAGALKNLDRAVLIGSPTFGKGSVQVLYDNTDGSKLKLTIAQYLTPGDKSIQSVGITPDINLHRMYVPQENTNAKHQIRILPSERTYKEADLDAHLTSSYAQQAGKPAYELRYLYEPDEDAASLDGEDGPFDEAEPLDDEFKETFDIQLARELVAQSDSSSRKSLVRQAKRLLERRRAEQSKKLIDAFAALGVDWSAAPARRDGRPELEADVRLEPSGRLVAGQSVKLVGTVKNTGAGTAYRVHVRARSDHHVFDEVEMAFGKIPAGESREWTTHLEIPRDAVDRVDHVELELREAGKVTGAIRPLKTRIAAAERPVFAYSHQLIDDGNGDGLVQKGERHRLRVTVKNIGDGAAPEPTALLRNASGDGIVLKKARFELGDEKKKKNGETEIVPFASGAEKSVEFVFEVSKEFREDEVTVELTVYDSVLHESVSEKLRYDIDGSSDDVVAGSGFARVTRDDTDVREGASTDAGQIAWADKGAAFRVTGRVGPWTRVQMPSGHPGFIASARLKKAGGGSAGAKLRRHWQVTPPSLSLTIPNLETSAETYHLRGSASDETRVEDVYIFVSNSDAKVSNRKVFYQSNRRGKTRDKMRFDAEIPLWKGSNRVTVIVRENDEVKSSQSMVLYRTSGTATAAAR